MSLKDARTRIDDLDDRILALLEERAGIVADVLAAKKEASLPTYDPAREREVLERLSSKAGRFPADAVRAVFREVMSACLALQEPTRVAYLGPEGTYSHMAARTLFGLSARYSEQATLQGVFDAVASKDAAYGVAPIENSTEGAVVHSVDALIEGSVFIRGELELEIAHCLLGRAAGLTTIERVYSHPQALGQCRNWLAANLPGAQLVQTSSTAAATREALADPRGAAIASRLSADVHGVPVLRERIHDRADNVTRFVVLGTERAVRTGNDKTTLAFSLEDGKGALRKVLALFEDGGVNLSRIQSRPSHAKAWDYVFLVDVDGHTDDEPVARVVAKLASVCPTVKHLGSYPKAAAAITGT